MFFYRSSCLLLLLYTIRFVSLFLVSCLPLCEFDISGRYRFERMSKKVVFYISLWRVEFGVESIDTLWVSMPHF
jgi:hypothetical protein